MKRQRSKNLDPSGGELIVGLFDRWTGPLSWERVIDAVEMRLFFRYTRQTLSGHHRIREAFVVCKERLANAPSKLGGKPISPEHRALLERLARRDAEVMRLRAENQRLTEQFVVWIYNAHIRGVSLSDLERPLPPADRGQTRRGLRAVESGK